MHGGQTTLYDMMTETRTKGSKAYLSVITPNGCVGRGDDGYNLWYDRRQSDRARALPQMRFTIA